MPEEVAHAIAYLARPVTRSAVGSVLTVVPSQNWQRPIEVKCSDAAVPVHQHHCIAVGSGMVSSATTCSGSTTITGTRRAAAISEAA